MSTPLKLLIIAGSNRTGRFCDTIIAWVLEHLNTNQQFELDLIDPIQLNADCKTDLMERSTSSRIAEADAYLIITPEYNHGYPAILKQIIDVAYAEWKAKPLAFISYGGVSGGSRSVEQLRQVFAELHVVTLRDAVSFINAWQLFNAEGQLIHPESHERSLNNVLQHLSWWGQSLKTAKINTDYPQS